MFQVTLHFTWSPNSVHMYRGISKKQHGGSNDKELVGLNQIAHSFLKNKVKILRSCLTCF